MLERPIVGTAPDYTDTANWMVLPQSIDYPVDVIYLYPSACMDPASPVICDIDDASMVQTAKDYFAQNKDLFDGVGNVFAPWYRQVNGALLAGMTFEQVDAAQWAEPRTDVYAAMDYYFENLNEGRPWFIAGHSQGSRMLSIVLAEYMLEHPDYYKRMICAYRVGDGLTRPYLAKYPHVKAAQCADDLGVCASWNTEGPGNKGVPSLVVPPEAVAINPLNWCVDETPAGEELCLGCRFHCFPGSEVIELEERISTVLDLERGVVVVTTPGMAKYSITESGGEIGKLSEPLFGPESFHNCDWSFFLYNVRENMKLRAKKWLETH